MPNMKNNINKNKPNTNHAFMKDDAYKVLEFVNVWTGNIDLKASFLLAYLAVIIGSVASKNLLSVTVTSATNQFSAGNVMKISIIIILLCLLISSVFLVLETLLARIKNTNAQHSLLFFGDIATLRKSNFKAKVLNQTEEELVNDLLEQIYICSEICVKKIKYYNYSVILTLILTILYIICMILNIL